MPSRPVSEVLSEAQVRELAAIDGFWGNYTTDDAGQANHRAAMRLGLHRDRGKPTNPIAAHYAAIAKKLS